MKISVCIASYNGDTYLVEQLNSIIDQLRNYDYEILLSDDGSTDETLLLVQSFHSAKIKVLKGPQKGLIRNFENSLIHASGDIIFLSDQDDVWLPNKVEKCIKLLEKYDLVVSDARVVDAQLKVLSDSFFQDRLSGRGIIKNLYKNSYLGCCMAFNKTVLEVSLPFPSNIAMHDWWIGMVADSISDVKFLEEPLVLYRRHEGNASDTAEKSQARKYTQVYWRLSMLFYLILRFLKVKIAC